MTAFIITGFYCYFVFCLRYYKKEWQYRKIEVKAPLSIKITVLFLFLIFIFNLIVCFTGNANILILLHFLPVVICNFIMWRKRRKLAKYDKKEGF